MKNGSVVKSSDFSRRGSESMSAYYRRTGMTALGGNVRTRGNLRVIRANDQIRKYGKFPEMPSETIRVDRIFIYRNSSRLMLLETAKMQYFFEYPEMPYNFMLDYETPEYVNATQIIPTNFAEYKMTTWGKDTEYVYRGCRERFE